MAMEVVILRIEMALGRLQGERERNGYIEGDAGSAISIATEAQGMAERLNILGWLGRAAYWRGISEWMGDNNSEAESQFETSASYHWTEPKKERDVRQE